MCILIVDTDDEEKIKSQILNDPFDDIPFTKKILNRNARTECISPGVIKVSLSKTVYQVRMLIFRQSISFVHKISR